MDCQDFFASARPQYAQMLCLSVSGMFRKQGGIMPELLIDLERKKSELLEEVSGLRDFRAGSISALIRRCGKPTCRCAQIGDPGHGPNLRLTYKLLGKTYSESLPDQAAVRRAQAEIAEFRKFQRLVKALVEVSTKICRLRSSRTSASTRAPKNSAG